MQIPKSARRRTTSGSVAVPPPAAPPACARPAASRSLRPGEACASRARTGATGRAGSGASAACARRAGHRPRVNEAAFLGVGQGMRDARNDGSRALGYAEGQPKTFDRTTIFRRLPPRHALRLVTRIRCRRSRRNRFVPQSMHRAARIAFVISNGDKEPSSDDRLSTRTLMPNANARPGSSRTDNPCPSRIAGWLSRALILGEFITLIAFAARRPGSACKNLTGRTYRFRDEDSRIVTFVGRRSQPAAQLSTFFP